jgi:hypothetical protein
MMEKGQLVECRECGGEIDTMTTSGYEHVLDEGREWWWCQECARVKRMERVLRELRQVVQDELEAVRIWRKGLMHHFNTRGIPRKVETAYGILDDIQQGLAISETKLELAAGLVEAAKLG